MRAGRHGNASAPRAPVIIYSSTDVHPEMADQMKCKGALAEVGNPDVLFAWIVRALDAGFDFKPSPEIERFCMEQRRTGYFVERQLISAKKMRTTNT